MQRFYFLTVIALIVVPSLAEKTSWPGKSCVTANGATDCETATTGLTCSNTGADDKCNCDRSVWYRMEFYPATGKCVLPVGASCTGSPPAEDRITPNAACAANTVVACTTGYTASGSRCLKSTGPCTKNSDCDEDVFETCEGLAVPANAKCGCSAGSQRIGGVCQLNADQACPATGTYPGKGCNAQSTCTGTPSKCVCNPGLEKTDEANCRVPYLGDCSKGSTDSPCNEVALLECRYDICVCESRQHDIWYDRNLKKCAIRAGARCIPWNGEQPCVSNAKCEGTGPSNGVCKCQDQFDFDADWLCTLKYGAPCTVANDLCDMKANQKCIAVGTEANGNCTCSDRAKMNLEGKVCKYKVGEKCSPTSGPGCVLHSQCKKVGDDTICACDAPFTKNSKGNCVSKHGGFCTSNSHCDSDAFLECGAEGKCTCPIDVEYDTDEAKCGAAQFALHLGIVLLSFVSFFFKTY